MSRMLSLYEVSMAENFWVHCTRGSLQRRSAQPLFTYLFIYVKHTTKHTVWPAKLTLWKFYNNSVKSSDTETALTPDTLAIVHGNSAQVQSSVKILVKKKRPRNQRNRVRPHAGEKLAQQPATVGRPDAELAGGVLRVAETVVQRPVSVEHELKFLTE